MSCDKRGSNDTHDLLRVVEAMAGTEKGRRDQLQMLEPHFRFTVIEMAAAIEHDQGNNKGDEHANERGQKNERRNFDDDGAVDGMKAVGHDSRPREAADERVRRGGGNTPPPREQVPDDGADDTGQDDGQRDVLLIDRLRHGVGDAKLSDDVFRDEESQKVEKGRPYHSLKRREHLCRDNGGDGVGSIVETVDEVKGQRKDDN